MDRTAPPKLGESRVLTSTHTMVHLRHKPTEVIAKKTTRYGLMWTPRGPRWFAPGWYIITAKTGCRWPASPEHVRAAYDFLPTDL